MTMLLHCACGQEIPRARRHAKLEVLCPACGAWVSSGSAGDSRGGPSDDLPTSIVPPVRDDTLGETVCPVCHGVVAEFAFRCRHCGRILRASMRHLQGRQLRVSRLALGGLVCGVLSFVFPVNLAALVVSALALRSVHRHPEMLEGVWIAQLGLLLGCSGSAYLLYNLLLPR